MGVLSKNIVGVDIGHSSVKVVGLELGKKPVFIGCKEITMDPKYLEKGGFSNLALIAQALKEAMKTAAPRPIRASLAYSAISEDLVFRKIIELSLVEGREKEIIGFEVAKYLPESPESMEIDYQILEKSAEADKHKVMVVAVSRKIVQQYVDVFNAAKLTLKAIDAKPAAIGRAVVSVQEKDSLVLVDIGSETTTVTLFDQSVVRVTSTLNIGGNIVLDSETGEVDEAAEPGRVKRLVTGIIDEIDHVQKFYVNHSSERRKIKEIRLCGGGSMIGGLTEAIQKQTELKVVAGHPVISLPAFCDRRFIGALGSALYPVYEKI